MYTESIWRRLQHLEREQRERYRLPGHMRRPGPLNHGDDPAAWRRVDALRGALWQAGRAAEAALVERLPDLDIPVMAGVVVTTGQDIALECGCLALAGAGSPGNRPWGMQPIPDRIAAMVGLPGMAAELGRDLSPVLARYERGMQIAWGRGWGTEPDPQRGAYELSAGHVQLGVVILRAWVVALRPEGGDLSVRDKLLQACRQGLSLGTGVGDWLLAQEERMLAHPMLKPASQRIEVASARSSKQAEAPVTLSQVLRQMGAAAGPGSQPVAPAQPQQASEDEPLQLDQDRQAETLRLAAQKAMPFCEECARGPREARA